MAYDISFSFILVVRYCLLAVASMLQHHVIVMKFARFNRGYVPWADQLELKLPGSEVTASSVAYPTISQNSIVAMSLNDVGVTAEGPFLAVVSFI